MKDNKNKGPKKNPLGNLNQGQKIGGSILIIIAAVLLILAIVFGVKWHQTKNTLSNFTSTITLNIDDTDHNLLHMKKDQADKPDFTFTFTENVAGESLEDVLEKDLPSNSPFSFVFKSDMLTSITYNNKTKTNAKDWSASWSLFSSTANNYMAPYNGETFGKEQMCGIGAKDLIMGPKNEFTFAWLTSADFKG